MVSSVQIYSIGRLACVVVPCCVAIGLFVSSLPCSLRLLSMSVELLIVATAFASLAEYLLCSIGNMIC